MAAIGLPCFHQATNERLILSAQETVLVVVTGQANQVTPRSRRMAAVVKGSSDACPQLEVYRYSPRFSGQASDKPRGRKPRDAA